MVTSEVPVVKTTDNSFEGSGLRKFILEPLTKNNPDKDCQNSSTLDTRISFVGVLEVTYRVSKASSVR